MHAITILVADDHDLVRSGIVQLLQSFPEFRIVGEARNGQEALDQAKVIRPTVLIMDLSMPVLSGIEAAGQLRAECPETNVLVLTMHDDERYVLQILESGAMGYVLKNASKTELAEAVRTVARGERYLSKTVSNIVIDGYLRNSGKQGSAMPESPLTRREVEVLRLVAEGLSSQEIAKRLYISPRTVDTHRTNMMQKLDLHDVASLVHYALEHRLLAIQTKRRHL
jgi:two-component system response regulator NreC